MHPITSLSNKFIHFSYIVKVVGFESIISKTYFSFTMTKTCPAIIDAIGIYGLFFIFASVAFFAGVFASIFMPETKGPRFNIDTINTGVIRLVSQMKIALSLEIQWKLYYI